MIPTTILTLIGITVVSVTIGVVVLALAMPPLLAFWEGVIRAKLPTRWYGKYMDYWIDKSREWERDRR